MVNDQQLQDPHIYLITGASSKTSLIVAQLCNSLHFFLFFIH